MTNRISINDIQYGCRIKDFFVFNPTEQVFTTEESIMTDIHTYFEIYHSISQQLLMKFYSSRKNENIVFSPFSVLMMLAMVAEATSGNTREEIAHVLSEGSIRYEDTLVALKSIHNALTGTAALSSANAVCVNSKIAAFINSSYGCHLEKLFDGELFTSSDMVSDVNNWVKKATHGMIDRIADDSIWNMLACLMNS